MFTLCKCQIKFVSVRIWLLPRDSRNMHIEWNVIFHKTFIRYGNTSLSHEIRKGGGGGVLVCCCDIRCFRSEFQKRY